MFEGALKSNELTERQRERGWGETIRKKGEGLLLPSRSFLLG